MITYNRTNRRMMAMLGLMLALETIMAPAGHAQAVYSVRIENASRYTIDKVFLSPSADNNWRWDLLGSGTLPPGYFFTTNRYFGTYDLKLVDEDGDVCIVPRVAVHGTTNWRITDDWLLGCERSTESAN